MAYTPKHERLTGFHSLPSEIRHHIFEYIYPQWHFEYTQVHDTLPSHGPKDIKAAVTETAAELTSTPRFSNLPSIAPLLVCRDFHNAGRHIFDSSFTGHMNVISGMIWKEVHWSYACVMAKAKTLTVNESHLKSLHQCKILDRLPNLNDIIITSTALIRPYGYKLPYRLEDCGAEVPQTSDRLPLEGAEITTFLPNHIDTSDASLQEWWDSSDGQQPVHLPGMHLSLCFFMEYPVKQALRSMSIRTICRAVIGLPVLPEYANKGFAIFMVSCFRYHFNHLHEWDREYAD